MKYRKGWVALTGVVFAIGSLLFPRCTAASFDNLVTVAQPMENGDAGQYEMHDVTYYVARGSVDPGLEVALTCSKGLVQNGDRLTSEAIDRNAAHLAGFRIRLVEDYRRNWDLMKQENRRDARTGELQRTYYIDTLTVVLDLRAGMDTLRSWRRRDAAWLEANRGDLRGDTARAARWRRSRDQWMATDDKQFAALVESTVDCILENARRSDVPIRLLRLEIAGTRRFQRLAHTYRIPSARSRTLTRRF